MEDLHDGILGKALVFHMHHGVVKVGVKFAGGVNLGQAQGGQRGVQRLEHLVKARENVLRVAVAVGVGKLQAVKHRQEFLHGFAHNKGGERFALPGRPLSEIVIFGGQTHVFVVLLGELLLQRGLLGLGLGNSRQKYLYLPEEHNDFIFSVVCEELGYIGAVLILVLFALLIVRGYWLSMHARDRYSFLAGMGLTTLLALQVILNVAVCTNTVPCTGISLPFFSYGGTALLLQMAEMGIILSLSRDIPEKK